MEVTEQKNVGLNSWEVSFDAILISFKADIYKMASLSVRWEKKKGGYNKKVFLTHRKKVKKATKKKMPLATPNVFPANVSKHEKNIFQAPDDASCHIYTRFLQKCPKGSDSGSTNFGWSNIDLIRVENGSWSHFVSL